MLTRDWMNKRAALRFEKVFPVILSTEEFGECNAMARNISAGGILIEMQDPMPLGTAVRVHFFMNDSQATIIARGEVKNHYFLNFNDAGGGQRSLTGMAIKFSAFEAEAQEMLGLGLTRMRILH
jgi:hypothetical protein